jgi:hypothetical protein
MSDNTTIDTNIKIKDADHTLMLSEVSKYFCKRYQRMINEMTKDDVRRLWHILHGRSK